MTIVRNTRQFTTVASTLFEIFVWNPNRVKGMVIVNTAAAVTYVGTAEQLSATTGMFLPVSTALYFGPGGLDPVNELSGIETTGGKVISIYEEISDDPEHDYQ